MQVRTYPPSPPSFRVTLGGGGGGGGEKNANEWTVCGCDDKGGKAKPLKQPKKEKREEDEEDKVCFSLSFSLSPEIE